MNSKIKVTVNAQEKEFIPTSTINDVVESLNIKTNSMFVVEKNLEIVPKDAYESTVLKDGDTIEIVGFFGGG